MLFPVVVDGKHGFMNANGELIIPCQYSHADDFYEGLAAISFRDKFGYIDENGDIVIKPIFDECGDFENGEAIVFLDGKYRIINKNGDFIFNDGFDYLSNFDGGLAIVEISGKCGAIDRNGTIRINPVYDDMSFFDERGWCLVKKGRSSFFINTSGEVVLKPNYSYIGWFCEDLAVVGRKGKRGYIDRTGKLVIPTIYNGAYGSSEGFLAVKSAEKALWGFLNRNGDNVIEFKYHNVIPYTDGFAAVCCEKEEKESWGFINISGEIIIEPKWDEVWPFRNGLAKVIGNNMFVYLDTTGHEVWRSQLRRSARTKGEPTKPRPIP